MKWLRCAPCVFSYSWPPLFLPNSNLTSPRPFQCRGGDDGAWGCNCLQQFLEDLRYECDRAFNLLPFATCRLECLAAAELFHRAYTLTTGNFEQTAGGTCGVRLRSQFMPCWVLL